MQLPYCTICLDEESTAHLKFLLCVHLFCGSCLNLVEKKHEHFLECPICRTLSSIAIEEINLDFKCSECLDNVFKLRDNGHSIGLLSCNHYVCSKCMYGESLNFYDYCYDCESFHCYKRIICNLCYQDCLCIKIYL